MDKIQVVYWSQSGNTQVMAEAIGKGIQDSGKEANIVYVGDASLVELKAAKVFALGCPAMGADVLEEKRRLITWQKRLKIRLLIASTLVEVHQQHSKQSNWIGCFLMWRGRWIYLRHSNIP